MLEIKNNVRKMKNIFAKSINRMPITEEKTGKPVNMSVKTFHNEIQRGKKMKRKKKSGYIRIV